MVVVGLEAGGSGFGSKGGFGAKKDDDDGGSFGGGMY